MGFLSPVGAPTSQRGLFWPPGWIDATGYAVRYRIGTPAEAFHTGADLNLNTPIFDSDAHKPVYPVIDGLVTFVGKLSGWGSVIVIRHMTPHLKPILCRYAHVENVQVKVGQWVTQDTHICNIGNADGQYPYHLHFDWSETEILATSPGDWPRLDLARLRRDYADPKERLALYAGWDHTARVTMQLVVNLRLRLIPTKTAGVVRVMQSGELVSASQPIVSGTTIWRHVTTTNGQGFAAEVDGAERYMVQPTLPPPPPPPPPGPNPYEGQIGLWHWKGSVIAAKTVDELADSVRMFNPEMKHLFLKTSDGATWQGAFDTSALAINGPGDVDDWVRALAVKGMVTHVWATVHGTDIDGEAEKIIAAGTRPGVVSVILDVEPYTGYWQGGRSAIRPLMERLRAGLGADYHIGLCTDPRPQHYNTVFPAEWQPFVNSVLPMCYWTTFQETPEETLATAFATWSGFGKPIYPILQGAAPATEIAAACKIATEKHGAKGVSAWRLGVIAPQSMAAFRLKAEEPPPPPPPPPPPDPDENLRVTADKLNVRESPTTDAPIVRQLLLNQRALGAGVYAGKGATRGFMKLHNGGGFVSRDWLRKRSLSKIGIHVHFDYDENATRAFIMTGNCASITVIGDWRLANWALDYCDTVVYRMAWTDHDPGPWQPRGNYVSEEDREYDIRLGERWFYEGIDANRNYWWWNKNLDRRVYLQIHNEWNAWDNSYFEIGTMRAAQREGYRMAIDNFAVGQPADPPGARALWFDPQGFPHSDIVPGRSLTVWDHMIPAIVYAQQNGHLYGVHVYGNIEVGRFAPLSDDLGFEWYGGRPFEFYRITPRPYPFMIITEAGPGKAELQQDFGYDAMLRDMKRYDEIVRQLPYVLAFNWWTVGARRPVWGFPGASIDHWLPQLTEFAKTYALG
jgi:hypothetical protein